jgi:hypothetical protein
MAMKTLFSFLVFVLGFAAMAADVNDNAQIYGTWLHYRVIYKGVERDPFNPDLKLTYTFNSDGTDRLFWNRKGEEQRFCERQGNYTYENQILEDQVKWVNPANASECAQDPDMQLGKITKTPVVLKNGDMHLTMRLGEEELIYIWKLVPAP